MIEIYSYNETDFVGLTGSPGEIDLTLLHGEVVASGITSQTFYGCYRFFGNTIHFTFSGEITAGEQTTLDNVVATHTGQLTGAGELNHTTQYCVAPSTYTNNQSKTIILPNPMLDCFVRVYEPNQLILQGATLVSAGGTGIDCGNVSTGQANINNGNLTDLCYNNSSSGNTSGVAFGIDLGTPTAINGVKRFDYSATYYDTEWIFWGSSSVWWNESGDPIRFPTEPGSPTPPWDEEIFRHYQTAAATNPDPEFVVFPEKTYRYYGVACVTSAHATYTIISELELYSGTEANVDKEMIYGTDFDYSIVDSTTIEVTNKGAEKDFKVVVMGREDV